MARITFVTGGCRSGKSHYALRAAEELQGDHLFIATCPDIDGETRDRIRRHRKSRNAALWKVLEEERDLAGLLARLDGSRRKVVLVDCLSLWVNNWMYFARRQKRKIAESDMEEMSVQLLLSAKKVSGEVFLVSQEAGLGIVPAAKEGRLYRDLLGLCNRVAARFSDRAVLLVSGIPLTLK